MKKFFFSLVVITSFVIGGCATIVGGGESQVVNFASTPEGAEIYLGKLVGGEVSDLVNTGEVTPKSIAIPRKNAVVILKKEGYEDTTIQLVKVTNEWFFGNIIIGGLLGSAIDSSTGAIMKYDPENFHVELVEK